MDLLLRSRREPQKKVLAVWAREWWLRPRRALDRFEQQLEHRLRQIGDRRNLSRSSKNMRHIAVDADA